MTSRVRDDAASFLRRWHRENPGATRRALARGRVIGAAASTYELVAAAAAGAGGVVVDLGCGDGGVAACLPARVVIGVDVSREELAAGQGPRVQARMEALPLRDGAVDVVTSHLSLMLVPDVAAGIAEIARVLAPGGRLVALVGGGPSARDGDAYAAFAELVAARRPRIPRLGDPRLRSTRGIAGVVGAGGFEGVRQEDFDVDLSGTFEEVWATLRGVSYEVAGIDGDEVAGIREELRDRFGDGVTACTMHVRRVTATRSDGQGHGIRR